MIIIDELFLKGSTQSFLWDRQIYLFGTETSLLRFLGADRRSCRM